MTRAVVAASRRRAGSITRPPPRGPGAAWPPSCASTSTPGPASARTHASTTSGRDPGAGADEHRDEARVARRRAPDAARRPGRRASPAPRRGSAPRPRPGASRTAFAAGSSPGSKARAAASSGGQPGHGDHLGALRRAHEPHAEHDGALGGRRPGPRRRRRGPRAARAPPRRRRPRRARTSTRAARARKPGGALGLLAAHVVAPRARSPSPQAAASAAARSGASVWTWTLARAASPITSMLSPMGARASSRASRSTAPPSTRKLVQ